MSRLTEVLVAPYVVDSVTGVGKVVVKRFSGEYKDRDTYRDPSGFPLTRKGGPRLAGLPPPCISLFDVP